MSERGLREALCGMLASQDCEWENRNLGHDWAKACQVARAELAKPTVGPGEQGDRLREVLRAIPPSVLILYLTVEQTNTINEFLALAAHEEGEGAAYRQGREDAANFLEREALANFMPNSPEMLLVRGLALCIRKGITLTGTSQEPPADVSHDRPPEWSAIAPLRMRCPKCGINISAHGESCPKPKQDDTLAEPMPPVAQECCLAKRPQGDNYGCCQLHKGHEGHHTNMGGEWWVD